jgi:hypothetical protein
MGCNLKRKKGTRVSKPRVAGVRFRAPQGGGGYIEATFSDKSKIRFQKDRMLGDIKASKLSRLKLYIIADMAFERAQSGSRGVSLPIQDLLAEFQTACVEVGVSLTGTRSKEATRPFDTAA